MSETVFPPPPPPPPSIKPEGFNLENNISPSILLIIIILAIIFFVSSLLHLLIRFLMKPPRTHQEDYDNVTALQGQLQQLFHLHDSGVDQSFIDTLPVFYYKAIIGSKNPFDCAVCLCEFEGEHKLRLLPKCSHAFHMECIDTWLLSHSTCPLCRASLLPDFSPNNGFSPVVLVLESGDESSREMRLEREVSVGRTSSRLGFNADFEMGSSRFDLGKKSVEMVKEEDTEEKIVSVKLGKCKNGGGGGGGEGSSGSKMVDSRRCFSMGSFEYVMEENLSLRVPIKPPSKNQQSKKTPLPPLKPGYKSAMSECDCESRREFKFSAFESAKTIGDERQETSSNKNVIFKERESFSVSKIWLQEKKGVDSSRRAFSFRFPVHRTGGTIAGDDEENQSCNSLDNMANPPSFARKTLLWLMGRQNKIVHSSFPPKI